MEPHRPTAGEVDRLDVVGPGERADRAGWEVPEPAARRPATQQGDPVLVDAQDGRVDGSRRHVRTMAHVIGTARAQPQSGRSPPRSGSGRNTGMEPSATTRSASVPSASRQPRPSVISTPTATGSAPARRTRARAAAVRRPGGDDVVDHRHPPAPHRPDPGRVHPQGLLGVGGDRPHRLGQGLTQVDLGGLVQDHVVVEPQGATDLDGQRDAHGGHRHHQLGPEGGQQRGELPSGGLGEGHAEVDADEQGDGAVVRYGHQGEVDRLGAHGGAIASATCP